MFCLGKCCFFVFLITLFCDSNYASRKLSHYETPYCNSTITTCNDFFLIKAEGSEDSLYYAWDLHDTPRMGIFQVPGQSNCTWDWNTRRLTFSTDPSYYLVFAIDNIYEFNDETDSGILHNDDTQNIKLPTAYFNWRILEFLDDLPDNSIRYTIGADRYQHGNITKTGLVNITSFIFGNDGHSFDLPHLLHTENSTQIDVILDNLQVAFNRSRFAVELEIGTVSTVRRDAIVKLSAKKTLDDENTPGVFILDTLRIGDDNDTAHSSFLQWRPIVYTSPNKVVTNSTKTFEYDLKIEDSPWVSDKFNSKFMFEPRPFPHVKVVYQNISFGGNGDGFYTKTKYSSWSFLVGIGISPEPQFSMVVFLIIAIGLGLPTLIIIGGTAFMIYRKVRTGN